MRICILGKTGRSQIEHLRQRVYRIKTIFASVKRCAPYVNSFCPLKRQLGPEWKNSQLSYILIVWRMDGWMDGWMDGEKYMKYTHAYSSAIFWLIDWRMDGERERGERERERERERDEVFVVI